MSTTNRGATLKQLHAVIPDTALNLGREHAIMMMAVRYGSARALEGDRELDYELVNRARSRRFTAMQRLVRALSK